jgi:Ceramidase
MESFCEEDYAITRYFAEFINTLTNLAYGMSASSLINELRSWDMILLDTDTDTVSLLRSSVYVRPWQPWPFRAKI